MPDDRATVLEVISDATNRAVVRMPGRRYPAAVFNGDSLHGLYTDLRDLEQQLSEVLENGHELTEELSAITDRLHERLWCYEEDLKRAGYLDLPYRPSVGAPKDTSVE